MTGTARKPQSVFNVIERIKRLEDDNSDKARIIYSQTQGISPGAGPQNQANPPENDQRSLHFYGEALDELFGYVASSVAISGNDLIINETSSGDAQPERGMIYVSPESGTTDDLEHVIGNVPSGAVFYLMGTAGNTITIKHNFGALDEGRLMCPDDIDFDLVGDDFVICVQDPTKSNLTWRLITNSGTGTEIADSDTKVVVNDSTPDIQFQIDGATAFVINKDGSGDERLLVWSGSYIDVNGQSIVNIGTLEGDTGTSTQLIQSTVNGWEHDVDTGEVHRFKVSSSFIADILGDGMDVGDEKSIQSASGFMGFSCASTKPTLTNTANVGAMIIPYKESTDSSPSSTTLNNWFGGDSITGGCLGIQYDSSEAGGSQNTLWMKSNSGWHRVVQT